MNIEYIRMIYDYNHWANARILESAARVPPEHWTSAALGYCQLRDTLVHALSAEWNWRSRWQGVSPKAMLDPADFPTLEHVRLRWRAEAGSLADFLAGLSDADLQARFAYTTTSGKPMSNMLWHTMVHLVNHGTQHRSELALLLTELGHSPGDIDIIAFLREKGL
jgi:uncharacterized damage-inducible protein DinB